MQRYSALVIKPTPPSPSYLKLVFGWNSIQKEPRHCYHYCFPDSFRWPGGYGVCVCCGTLVQRHLCLGGGGFLI